MAGMAIRLTDWVDARVLVVLARSIAGIVTLKATYTDNSTSTSSQQSSSKGLGRGGQVLCSCTALTALFNRVKSTANQAMMVIVDAWNFRHEITTVDILTNITNSEGHTVTIKQGV
jgi:hypothetical protein